MTPPSIQVVPDQLPTVSWTERLDVLLLALWMVASAIVLLRLVRALMVLARIRRESQPRVIDGIQCS